MTKAEKFAADFVANAKAHIANGGKVIVGTSMKSKVYADANAFRAVGEKVFVKSGKNEISMSVFAGKYAIGFVGCGASFR